MAQDPIELVKDFYYKGFIAQNPQFILSLLTDDIGWWVFGPPGFPCDGYYQGKTGDHGVPKFFEDLGSILGDTSKTFYPHEFYASPVPEYPDLTVVTALGLETGTLHQRGIENNYGFFNYWSHTFYIRAGKIVRFRANFTLIPPGSVPFPLIFGSLSELVGGGKSG